MIKLLAVVTVIIFIHSVYSAFKKVRAANTKKEKWQQAFVIPLQSWPMWLYFLLSDFKDIFG